MKALIPLVAAAAIVMGGCQKNDPEPGQDVEGLKALFNGKYQVVSATSNIALDLNRDGKSSTNLSSEIPNLAYSGLEVRVRNGNPRNGYAGTVEQWWPRQYVTRNWAYNSPDSLIADNYVRQAAPRSFNFDQALTQLLLEQRPDEPSEEGQYPAPESITVVGPEELLVVTNRLFFVRRAWIPVRTVTLYKRYTKIT